MTSPSPPRTCRSAADPEDTKKGPAGAGPFFVCSSEPGTLPHLPHRDLARFRVEASQEELAVQVIGLVLQSLGEEALAFEDHRVAVEVDSLHACPWMALRVVPQAGNREAALPRRLGLAADFGQHGVEDISDVTVDVV